MISDYHAFTDPTCIAACEGSVAVFDGGDVVLFHGGEKSVYPTGLTDCYKLCVSSSGAYLLRGVKLGVQREIWYVPFSGEEKSKLEIPMSGINDIAFFDSFLYALAPTEVKRFSVAEQTWHDSFEISLDYNLPRSFAFAEDGSIWFLSSFGEPFRKVGNEYTVPYETQIGSVVRMLAIGANLYYAESEKVCILGQSNPVLSGGGTGDVAFSVVTDFAAADGKIYVLDTTLKAIKIYDVATKSFVKMIGSYGSSLGRLKDPVALATKDGKSVIADSLRIGIYADSTEEIPEKSTDRTDLTLAGESIFVADGGKLYEYSGTLLIRTFTERIYRFVASTPEGTVYASAGNKVYRKRTTEGSFSEFLTAVGTVGGLTFGIGGKILYVESGGTIHAYSQEGVFLWELTTEREIKSFAVDYRGNVYALSSNQILRYARTIEGYSLPVEKTLSAEYKRFADLSLDGDGTLSVIADHNVLKYSKGYFDVQIAEDTTFKDETPSRTPRFVIEVTNPSVAYATPDNFEDITPVAAGTTLMAYAVVTHGADEYVRVEMDKGIAYIPKGDLRIYEAGVAPLKTARCLLPVVGTKVVGVNIYEEPSYLAIERGVEPLFSGLGKEDLFEVVSYVAVDENGKDVWGFYQVRYQEKIGYVLIDEVVSVDDEPQPMPTLYTARIKSDGLGKTVAIYREASVESEEIARLSDGTEVSLLEPLDQDKEFIMVLYEGEVYYVLSANLGQGGLSGGQVLAIVLSVVAVVGSVLTVLILRASKKHKRRQKE